MEKLHNSAYNTSEDLSDASTTLSHSGAEAAKELRQETEDIKGRVAEAIRRTGAKVDAQREPAAQVLENTAKRLREGTAKSTDAASRVAEVTADKLQSTANYIRENDAQAMMGGVTDVIRQHPGPALAVAALIGFFIGRAVGSRRYWQ